MEEQDIIQEFLIESSENLSMLDREMVELEQRPQDPELLASVFRKFHTLKGTCGFFGFSRLEAVAHVTENLLSDLRDGVRQLDAGLTSLILESIDAQKRILLSIESQGHEGDEFESDLVLRLRAERNGPEVRQNEAKVPLSSPLESSPPAPALEPARAAAPPVESPAPAAPAEAEAVAGTNGAAPGALADATLRVDVAVLDRLMNLVGELVLTRNQVLQYNAERDDAPLNAIAQRMDLITTELQEGVMKTRMQPIGLIWNKLPRVVRDLANNLGKDIDLVMDGADTELDRTIIDAIKDPLTHIVRNACDHGIEDPKTRTAQGKPARGRLALRAYHEGGQVNIEISDDGRGIDLTRVRAKAVDRGVLTSEQAARISDHEALRLVFLAGFSTAREVTSVSGRGVGMDVVKTHIERIGGTVELASRAGEGTTVRIKIPLTLAIIPGLVVVAGGERFVIPQISLHELIRLEGEAARTRIEHVHSAPVYRQRDELLPLTDLAGALGLTPQRSADEVSIAVLVAGRRRFGLIVDAISDSLEIVVKPLGQQLKGLNCYAGATIMGDGRIALILDVMGIASRTGVISSEEDSPLGDAAPTVETGADARRSLLLFRAGDWNRLALPLERVSRLEQIPAVQVERAGGREVVQYRDRLLPLMWVSELLGGVRQMDVDVLDVVVASNGTRDFGLVVDEIVDIVDEAVLHPRGAANPNLAGSAVVGGKVTDFLDLGSLLASADDDAEGLSRLLAALDASPVGQEVLA